MDFPKVGQKKYISPFPDTIDVLEEMKNVVYLDIRITCGLKSLYPGTIQKLLNEIRPFVAILLQIMLAYMIKNIRGIEILQKRFWLLHFRTSLHKRGLNSCTCLFFLSSVIRLLAQCVVDCVRADIPVPQECILCIVLDGF